MNASSLKGAVHHRHHILPSSSSSPPSFPISSSSSSSRVLSAAAATSLCPRQVVTVDLGLHSSSEDSKRMAVMMNTSAKSVVVAAADAQAKRLCSQLAISHNSNTTTQQYSAQWLLNNAAAATTTSTTTTNSNTTISNQTNQANNKTTSCMSCRSCQAVEDNLVVLPAIKQSMAAQYGGYYTPGAGLGQRLRLLLLLLAIFAACLSVQVAPVVVHSASVISGASGGGGGGAGGYGHGGIHGHAGHLLQTSGGSGANHGGGGQIIINAGGGVGAGGGEGRHGSLIAPQQVVDIEEEAAAALIKQYHQHLEDDSPPCADEHSICGYVQVNSVGFNRVSLCSCSGGGGSAEDGGSGGGGGRCPLWWERSTSRTVRHGNDFYKYCKRKPRLVPCMAGQVAYSSLNVYDKLTFDQVSVVHRAHCLCPADHILAANSSRPMFEQELENTILMGTEMLCTKMPRCSRRQFCLSISDGADATLEKRHCRCPLGQTCPKDPRQAAETQQMPRGAAYHMRCQ